MNTLEGLRTETSVGHLGERVYDVDRGIDYLPTRGDAGPRRIGVMGNSVGGTISVFSAALLPRIALAMPSCYFYAEAAWPVMLRELGRLRQAQSM